MATFDNDALFEEEEEEHSFSDGGGAHAADEMQDSSDTVDDGIDDWVDPFPDISLEELEEQIRQVEHENMVLEHETKIYKQYMADHMDSEDIEEKTELIDGSSKKGSSNARSSGFRRRSKNPDVRSTTSRTALTTTTAVPVSLTARQKVAITTRIQTDLRNQLENHQRESEKTIEMLRAEVEGMRVYADETDRTIADLQREANAGRISGKMEFTAEKFLRFLEDSIKYRDQTMSKCRLKTSSLATQKKTVITRLIQKEQNGEMLQLVDFEQLRIANQKYQAIIDEKNEEMLKLKKSTGTSVALLNKTNSQLQKLQTESDRLAEEIKSRKAIMSRLEKEAQTVENDQKAATEVNQHLQNQLAEFEVPSVRQYVQQKATVESQRKDFVTWQRRLEVAQSEFRRMKTLWKSVTTTSM